MVPFIPFPFRFVCFLAALLNRAVISDKLSNFEIIWSIRNITALPWRRIASFARNFILSTSTPSGNWAFKVGNIGSKLGFSKNNLQRTVHMNSCMLWYQYLMQCTLSYNLEQIVFLILSCSFIIFEDLEGISKKSKSIDKAQPFNFALISLSFGCALTCFTFCLTFSSTGPKIVIFLNFYMYDH